ncbi:MAG: dcp, partial [Phenylobacterium sp.]|nr:dcp [Phenylobacterium sp.]
MHPIRSLLLGAAACALTAGAAQAATKAATKGQGGAAPGGVFVQPSPLFLHAPQFDKIKDSDFKPAMEQGMARQKVEIAKIADNPAPATFDNTI